MKKVIVFGTFDHLHPGHEYLLHEAEKIGDLHVIIARDETVKHIKGLHSLQSETIRMQGVIDAFPSAEVCLGDEKDYLAPVRAIGPDVVVLGYDQKLPPGISMEDFSCEVVRVDAYEPDKYKSSLRRSAIEQSDALGE